MWRRTFVAAFPVILPAIVLSLLVSTVRAKDQPWQTITWPESGSSVLRFTFTKFKDNSGNGNLRTFRTETTAENLWSKVIPNANFSLYLFDKNRVRIGEATIVISNVRPGESVKFDTTISASGPPASISIVAKYLPAELGFAGPARVITITVNSVPQGAALKVDGTDEGVTPKLVKLTVGKHLFDFAKEGFNAGRFPFEVGSDDVSGGSVSYELGASVHDTVELRDGTVVSGDVESVTATDVVVRAGGKDVSYDRNQVKRILLIPREPAESGPTAQPAAQPQQ
jgi:hypothetical protein